MSHESRVVVHRDSGARDMHMAVLPHSPLGAHGIRSWHVHPIGSVRMQHMHGCGVLSQVQCASIPPVAVLPQLHHQRIGSALSQVLSRAVSRTIDALALGRATELLKPAAITALEIERLLPHRQSRHVSLTQGGAIASKASN